MASISSDHASSDHASSDHGSSSHTSNPTSSSHTSSNQQTVEFYVSSLWSWLPEGTKRVIEHLESFELEQARFAWDEECDWFRIQCLEDDKGYIMDEYLKIQSELEDELREMGVIEYGGSLIPIVENDLVGEPRCKVATSEDSGESFESKGTDNSEGQADLRYPKGHGPVKKVNNRHPKGHGPVKNNNTQNPKGHEPFKNGNTQSPKGHGPVKKTGKCQAPQKKEYGF